MKTTFKMLALLALALGLVGCDGYEDRWDGDWDTTYDPRTGESFWCGFLKWGRIEAHDGTAILKTNMGTIELEWFPDAKGVTIIGREWEKYSIQGARFEPCQDGDDDALCGVWTCTDHHDEVTYSLVSTINRVVR